jgi:transposase-like protein
MAKIDVVCPRCSEAHYVIRNGHSSSDAQLYRCNQRLKTFELNYRYNGAKSETHQAIVDMTMNGSGCRDTARIIRISINTALCHLKNYHRTK